MPVQPKSGERLNITVVKLDLLDPIFAFMAAAETRRGMSDAVIGTRSFQLAPIRTIPAFPIYDLAVCAARA